MECYSGKDTSRGIVCKKKEKTLTASLEFIQKFFLFQYLSFSTCILGFLIMNNNQKKKLNSEPLASCL